MDRRKFLQSGALFSIPMMVNGNGLTAISQSRLFTLLNDDDDDRVLVLIQLNGGNDGLNTFIPVDQYSKLSTVRNNILIPENKILSAETNNGFHPSMMGMKNMFDEGLLSVVQNVGYPNQNRSHFRSQDIWTSGSSANEFLSSGWLGRYLDLDFSDFPEGYPNTNYPDPLAITMGFSVSETCQGQTTNFSMALIDPSQFLDLDISEEGDVDESCYGQDVQFIRESIRQTNAYTDQIEIAYEKGMNFASYPESKHAEQLQIIARLIAGGLKTKIYIANLGGFDTHGDQVEKDDITNGRHAELLKVLSDAIAAFQSDVESLSLSERVMGMTFSEFGRRIKSNGSFGTDHGTAAPMFLFGSCIQNGVIGQNVELPDEIQNKDGVPMQFDFRSIYGSLLIDWFKAEEEQVREILFDDFQYIPLLNLCESPSSISGIQANFELKVFPNPCVEHVNLEFEASGNRTRISLFDSIGSLLKVIPQEVLTQGRQTVVIDTFDLIPGNYIIHFQDGFTYGTKIFSKI